MNNEPVAWWCAKEYADSDMEGGHVEELEFNQPSIHDPEGLIWEKPLYTHPAKTLTDDYCKAYWGKDNCFVDVRLPDSETEVIRFWNDQLNESYQPKTLTGAVGSLSDEEIKQVMSKFYSYNPRLLEFARAILRKANEK